MKHLLLEIENRVARVRLNRPKIRNAFDDVVVAELHQTANQLSGDDAVRVVVLSGEGPSFCAGADLNWMKRMVSYTKEENLRDAGAMASMFSAWDTLPKPVIGRIHGAAIGGGTGLVSVCDIAIAAEDTVFAFSEVRLGILPAVISPFVVARIGAGAGRELFLTGERFSAAQALRIGLVNRVVPEAELDAAVEQAAKRAFAGGPKAQSRIKHLMQATRGLSPEAAAPFTAEAIAEARAGDEGQDGMHAFLERRNPAWLDEP